MSRIISVRVDTGLFPFEAAVYASCGFIDRYYVSLDREGQILIVRFKPKPSVASPSRNLSDEFLNQVLFYTLRLHVHAKNKHLTETIVSQALGAAIAPVPGGENQGVSDPLGIAVPWEEQPANKGRKNRC
jgi:His-Xaa-Ser system protein HxsD